MSEARTAEVVIPATVTFYSGINGQRAVFGILENMLEAEPNFKFLPDQSSGVDNVTASDLMPTAIRVFNELSNEWLVHGKTPGIKQNSWKLSFDSNSNPVIYNNYIVEAVPAGDIQQINIEAKVTIREREISKVKELLLSLAGNGLTR